MTVSTWNEARDRMLTAMWANGDSGAVIAEAMGLSRNAILGRMHRLNLPARASPIKRRVGTTPAPRKRRKEMTWTPARPKAPQIRTDWRPHTPPPTPAECLNVPLAEVQESEGCRWPTNDKRPFTFCGLERAQAVPFMADPMPYCPLHRAKHLTPYPRAAIRVPAGIR